MIYVFSVALLVGASVLAATLLLVAQFVGQPAHWIVGVVAVLCAASLIRDPNSFRGSRWRIPQNRRRMRRVWYVGVYGLVLGASVATALPSVAFIALVSLALIQNSIAAVFVGFWLYALARISPALLILWRARTTPTEELEDMSNHMSWAPHAQVVLLLGIATVVLAS